MSTTLNYLECWTSVATSLLSQALTGEPVLSESLPKPQTPGSFAFSAVIEGDEAGPFAVTLDEGLAKAALLGEGSDQKAGWSELLREVADAAAGELLAKTGRKCRVADFQETLAGNKLTRAFDLKAGDRSWSIQVHSDVRVPKAAEIAAKPAKGTVAPSGNARASTPSVGAASAASGGRAAASSSAVAASPATPAALTPALELLLDVELEASLRFGAREMPLGEILDLGPGDVVQLDRHVTDPVDLIVGDKIVALGEVVLVNGNFGLRVTEVAEPQRRLESIRCLF